MGSLAAETTDGIIIKDHSLYINAKGNIPATGRRLVCIPTDTAYRTEVAVQTSEDNSGGLLLSYNDKAFTGIIANATKYLVVYDTAGHYREMPCNNASPIKLRIDNHSEKCILSISDDGVKWQVVAEGIDVSELQHNNYKGFLALKIGLVSIGQGSVRFNDFRYQTTEMQ